MEIEELRKSIGNRVQSLRNRNNVKQTDLANILGISTPTCYGIEKGTTDLGVVQLIRLCEFFQCNISDVVLHPVVKQDQQLEETKTALLEAKEHIIQLQHELMKRNRKL